MVVTKGEPPSALEQRVLGFIEEHQLISSNERLLVAVSGGPDSVCLLHILYQLRDKLSIALHIAHLNHLLRGAESRADAEYVSNLARQLAIPATIEEHDVKAYQAEHHLSLEEAAREVRYDFLARTAKSIDASRVAVGHTTDDHIETILMHLIRGAGTRGLCGLQSSSLWRSSENSVTVARPLLPVTRQETAGYCHSHKLTPRIDSSNLSLSPLRNRIRQQLLPLLESYNPRIVQALLRTARIAGDALAFLDKEMSRVWDEVTQEREKTIILDKEKFCQLPLALQRHLLRATIEKLAGNLKDIESRHIEEIMVALTKPAGKRISLPGGLIFTVEYDKFLLGQDPAALSPFPVLKGEFQLKIPGETSLPGWQVEATVIPPGVMKEDKSDYKAYLDFEQVGSDLMVRCRQPGDRFQPLGISQPKKLNEFMIDTKIPLAWRQRVPIVCSPEHIIWVVGWRIDDRVKVTRNTTRILCLKFRRAK